MAANRPYFYGWILLGVAWVCYGFGISPAYFSWGFLAPEMIRDLGLNREQFGGVFGVFTFLYSAVGPVVGILQDRIGTRWVMTLGFVISAIGLFMMSRAETLFMCYIAFGLLGGAGIGLATIVPCQTLGQNWFVRWRARAIAIIFTAGGLVGMMVAPANTILLEQGWTWRDAWFVIACISGVLAVVSALLIRDTPEELGQRPDGDPPGDGEESTPYTKMSLTPVKPGEWTAWQAIRTPQFLLLVFAGVAYAVPWGVVISHGRLHMQEFNFEIAVIASFFFTISLVSTGGRLVGGLGDWIPPQMVLAGSLVLESIGVGLLIVADTALVAYASMTLIGVGFGAAYISVPVVFAGYFGRRAFGTTTGMRILITGVFNAMGPWLTGRAYDRLESYTVPFLVLVAMGLVGALAAGSSRPPGPAPAMTAAPDGARVAP